MIPVTQAGPPSPATLAAETADAAEVFAPFLRVYRDHLPVFRRQAARILAYYGDFIEPDDLVQMAALSLWQSRRPAFAEIENAGGWFVQRMRAQASHAAVNHRLYRQRLGEHLHHTDMGLQWDRRISRTRPTRGCKVLQVGSDACVGDRVLALPDEILLSPACAAFLRAIAALLPLRWVAMVAVHYMAGYSYSDVGRSFGVSESTVSSILLRARSRLRRHPHLAEILRGERETLPVAEMAVVS